MVKPYLLDGESATYWKEGVFTKEAADTVLADLYQVVEDSAGTAHAAQRDAFRMAGKTGTAELKISKDDTEGQELGKHGEAAADYDDDRRRQRPGRKPLCDSKSHEGL